MTPADHAALVKARARILGFEAAGISDLSPVPHAGALTHWLAAGMAGTMDYMRRQLRRRLEPATILPGAVRAVVVAKNYHHSDEEPRTNAGRVARYARGRDYHVALREPLNRLASYIVSLGGADTVARGYVDAGPVPERELAQRAGLGWIGKNTMLIAPGRGSYFFLATVLTNLDLLPDKPFTADRCGRCHRCLDACPTGAFSEERVLDSRNCISYLTIEHRGEIDASLQNSIEPWVFGCDVCQEVCPWNVRFAEPATDPVLQHIPSLEWLDLDELRQLSEEEFDHRYGWTPLERPGAAGLQRNARVLAAARSRAR